MAEILSSLLYLSDLLWTFVACFKSVILIIYVIGFYCMVLVHVFMCVYCML